MSTPFSKDMVACMGPGQWKSFYLVVFPLGNQYVKREILKGFNSIQLTVFSAYYAPGTMRARGTEKRTQEEDDFSDFISVAPCFGCENSISYWQNFTVLHWIHGG